MGLRNEVFHHAERFGADVVLNAFGVGRCGFFTDSHRHQKTQYDLIFMDMRMPNMDGLESTRKIRALGGAHKDIPIVALTANAFDDDRNACFDSGMNDFMTKPVSAEELQEMVLNWTKERQKMAS